MKTVANLLVFAAMTNVSVTQGQSKHTGCNEAVAPSFMQSLLDLNKSNLIKANTQDCSHEGVIDKRYVSETLTDEIFRLEAEDSAELDVTNRVNKGDLELFIIKKVYSNNGMETFQTVKGFSTLGN